MDAAPAFEIRTRIQADVEPLVSILRELHLNDRFPKCWPDDPAGWIAPGDEIESWVAFVDDAVVGQVSLQPATHESMLPFWTAATTRSSGELIAISRLIVGPSARGQGVGRALFEAAVGWAHDHARLPVLYTSDIDRAAQKLYERAGWIIPDNDRLRPSVSVARASRRGASLTASVGT